MHPDVPNLYLDLYLPRAPIMTGAETARVLGYPTTGALYKAHQRGQLPFELFKLTGRRGWFAATSKVKAWLEASLREDLSRSRPGLDQAAQ